ncbi:MAG: manganese-binding transcriptional regulator MntR [Planctomycetales bacterium]|nr:manganese-binding transcriptional regulator MntR [Planctomycetales bacterium]
MPSSDSAAARHRRTRNDHAQETAEDYVEAIAKMTADTGRCRVIDLARQFAVSHVTVSKVVSRLRREGLVKDEAYAPLELTPAGRKLAEESSRRHEIVYRFLRAIGVSQRTAEIDTEGIEHHVSPQTLDCFRKLAARMEK